MEFGSDFHLLDYPKGGKSLLNYFPESNLYASGRQALLDLAATRGWNRLWVPSYFCEESLECVSRAGIVVCRYECTPLSEPVWSLRGLPVRGDDGLLVVNYFGRFDKRRFPEIGCEIVEDHTHNLIGNWAVNSSADWCVASLRKTLPIADGGILWSPGNHPLPPTPEKNSATADIMDRRNTAMLLKSRYLKGGVIAKEEFLSLFRETEGKFDRMQVSSISDSSLDIVRHIDISRWYGAKRRNWDFLYNELNACESSVEILMPENPEDCPFSLTLRFMNKEARDKARISLIRKSVYPAVLWTMSSESDVSAKIFSDTMLSIHCDGRYSLNDTKKLMLIIKDSLN